MGNEGPIGADRVELIGIGTALSAILISQDVAGWITGLFYAAYTLSVPILVTLTDRIDPTVAAVSSLVIVVSLLPVLILNYLGAFKRLPK